MTLQPRKRKVDTPSVPRQNISGSVPDRYAAFLSGDLTTADLDDEEIFRGQIRSKDGSFRGRPPKLVPQQFATALQSEMARRYNSSMAGLVPDAIKAIERVMNKTHPQPGDGAVVNAAFKTLERFAGKVPDTVKLSVEQKEDWEKHMGEVIVDYAVTKKEITDGSEEPVDAEIVE